MDILLFFYKWESYVIEATEIWNMYWMTLVLVQQCYITHSNSRPNRLMKSHSISVRFTQVPAWKTKHMTLSTFLVISQQKELLLAFPILVHADWQCFRGGTLNLHSPLGNPFVQWNSPDMLEEILLLLIILLFWIHR